MRTIKTRILDQKHVGLKFFPPEKEIISKFKETFKNAKWVSSYNGIKENQWVVPTEELYADEFIKKLNKWHEETVNEIINEKEKRKEEFNKFDDELNTQYLESLKEKPIESNFVKVNGGYLEVYTPYEKNIVNMIKNIMGSKFHKKNQCWMVPLMFLEDLRNILPEIEKIIENMDEQSSPVGKTIILETNDMELGIPCEINSEIVVPINFGKIFKITKRMAETNEMPSNVVGLNAKYAYYRNATNEEKNLFENENLKNSFK